jgi:hypothetical protein
MESNCENRKSTIFQSIIIGIDERLQKTRELTGAIGSKVAAIKEFREPKPEPCEKDPCVPEKNLVNDFNSRILIIDEINVALNEINKALNEYVGN